VPTSVIRRRSTGNETAPMGGRHPETGWRTQEFEPTTARAPQGSGTPSASRRSWKS
jgi:hypothetical protein